jgi:hypothetical protein
MSEGQEIPDFAQVWVDANRSRTLVLMRCASTVTAALVKRWKHRSRSVSDRATSEPLPGHPGIVIAERAVRSGST